MEILYLSKLGGENVLQKYDTCELVKELSTREGVERIVVNVEDIIAISVQEPNEDFTVDSVSEGPMVVLQIID